MKTIQVKDVVLGQGAPKICVPIVGKNNEGLLEEAKKGLEIDCDIIEWRVDFYESVEDFSKVVKIGKQIREVLATKPILFTFRTKKEGGEVEMSDDKYFELYRNLIPTGLIDLVDVELFMDEKQVEETLKLAQAHNVKVVMCNHDFDKTPPKEEIVARLQKMQEKGADICKIAVMPQSTEDVLVLLEATTEMSTRYADRPIVTMSMGGRGMISRISGEVFGSAMTFGAATKTSAPGQVPVGELRDVLNLMHRSL